MSNARALRSQAGFTLIEVLVAMTVMLVGTVGAMTLIDRANATTTTTKSREAATSLARELVESARSIPYDRLTAVTVLPELSAQPGLADTVPGGAHTIVRRDVTFVVTGTVCVMDDVRDGGGDQTAGGFCPGSSSPSTPLDRNPEDYKRVTVSASWTRNGRSRSVSQTTIVNNPGAAGAPSVRSIAATNTPLPVTDATLDVVRFQILTSTSASTINWLLDGTVQAPAPSPDAARTGWTAEWNISGADDGAYIVAAEAFDEYGVSGPTRQLTVLLNRFLPKPPAGVSAGRNRYDDVEIEWAGNTERDIIGYEVRRDDGAVVCSLASTGLDTECRDEAPPPASAGDLVYRVHAYDRDPAGVERSGPASDPTTVIAGNLPPGMPANLRQGDSGATLTWDRPSPEDGGPTGDTISYYRIYRDGVAYANRYARWFDDSTTVSWTDPNPDQTSHDYWVAAVDTHYLESELAGGAAGVRVG